MKHRIFHQRLQNDFGYDTGKQLPVHLFHKGELSRKTDILYFNIISHMLQLLGKSQGILAFIQNQPVILGKGNHRRMDILHTSSKSQPIHHFQCIIEEMRIDLGLKRLQLRTFQMDAHTVFFIHKLVGMRHHIVIVII